MEINTIIFLILSALFFIGGLIVLSISAYLRIENDILRSYLEDDEIESLDEILELVYSVMDEKEDTISTPRGITERGIL